MGDFGLFYKAYITYISESISLDFGERYIFPPALHVFLLLLSVKQLPCFLYIERCIC